MRFILVACLETIEPNQGFCYIKFLNILTWYFLKNGLRKIPERPRQQQRKCEEAAVSEPSRLPGDSSSHSLASLARAHSAAGGCATSEG